ncbi:MAG: hypothetical protein A2017_09200 [Lentisphaerae bacterium GWF2_44_16]|nr:MAG: hypothetical protein A2017_09200 [Lentisphaerae bacterium GWF2_44_16]
MENIKLEKKPKKLKLSTDSYSVSVSRKDGMLGDFRIFDSEHGQWNDVFYGKSVFENKAGVRIKDELTGAGFSDNFGPATVFYHEPRKIAWNGKGSNVLCSEPQIKKSNSSMELTQEKDFKDAQFTMRNEYKFEKDFIQWDVVLKLRPGEKERSVRLEYQLPIFRSVNGGFFPKGWQVWAPLEDAPYSFGHAGGWGHSQASWYVHHFPYCSVNAGAGIPLPMIDVFSSVYDIGMSLIAPPGQIKPEMVFVVDKENSVLKLQYNNIGLRKTKEWRLSLILHPHRGDWREALGWFEKRYHDYFVPNNKRVIDQEGTMFYGVPSVKEKNIKAWVKNMGLKWTEVLYNPIFGDYVPEAEKWDFDMLWSEKGPEKILRGLTKKKIGDYLKMLKKHSVASFIYYNYGECDERLAKKNFSESIIRDPQGLRKAWMFRDGKRGNMTMNPDPDTEWGRFVLKQVDELFEEYPELDGLFIDQMCYHSSDYGRDDGRTMINNAPVYDTHEASMRMMEKIAEKLKSRNKTCFANGPYNFEIMKYADGIMSEGSLSGLAKYSYACLNKPVMVLTYNVFGEDLEKVFKACLKYGAFPSTPWHHDKSFNPPELPPENTLELYRRYLPLIENLRGRRWVLRSNAIVFPNGLDGNIFHRRAGGYVIPFFVKDSLISYKHWNASNPKTIEITLSGNEKIQPEIKWLSANFRGEKALKAHRKADKLSIAIPEFAEAAILIVKS